MCVCAYVCMCWIGTVYSMRGRTEDRKMRRWWMWVTSESHAEDTVQNSSKSLLSHQTPRCFINVIVMSGFLWTRQRFRLPAARSDVRVSIVNVPVIEKGGMLFDIYWTKRHVFWSEKLYVVGVSEGQNSHHRYDSAPLPINNVNSILKYCLIDVWGQKCATDPNNHLTQGFAICSFFHQDDEPWQVEYWLMFAVESKIPMARHVHVNNLRQDFASGT